MINTFTLRFTLFFVRLFYYLAPVIKFLFKAIIWILLIAVIFLLLLIFF